MITTLSTYQTGDFELPNSMPEPNGADFTADIQETIDNSERERLIKGLGIVLYDTLVAEHPNLGTASQPIQDLVNGKQYQIDGKTVRWEGLTPLLANYVYWKFLKEKQDLFTTMGTQLPKASNSTHVSPASRASRFYNNFLEAYQGGINENKAYRDRLGRIAYVSKETSSFRSLYQYLKDNEQDYPTADNFEIEGNSNMFSI